MRMRKSSHYLQNRCRRHHIFIERECDRNYPTPAGVEQSHHSEIFINMQTLCFFYCSQYFSLNSSLFLISVHFIYTTSISFPLNLVSINFAWGKFDRTNFSISILSSPTISAPRKISLIQLLDILTLLSDWETLCGQNLCVLYSFSKFHFNSLKKTFL